MSNSPDTIRIPLDELMACLSETLDMASPELVNHHVQVAYISHCVGVEVGLEKSQLQQLVMAAYLHDIGAFSLQTRQSLLAFEDTDAHHHARVGYQLLTTFPPFERAARLIRFHHVPWAGGEGVYWEGDSVPLDSHILHLADRAAVLLRPHTPALHQASMVCERISEQSGTMFMPDLVNAFLRASASEVFWFDLISSGLPGLMRRRVHLPTLDLGMDGLLLLADLFRRIIDFRSPFTATHCSGVAASAGVLARYAAFSERDRALMLAAAYLHDLGKLAVPTEIIEKPGRLSPEEFEIMQSHVYHTFRVLEPIAGLEEVRRWGSYHQERLDGSGYPFRLKGDSLPAGARLLAVADIFTALTENRPYREGMPAKEAVNALQRMAKAGQVDREYVALVVEHFEELDHARQDAQDASTREYTSFQELVGN